MTNFKEIDLTKPVTYLPEKIQFNNLEEWELFKNRNQKVLNFRHDWYFNSETLVFVQ